MTVAMEEPAAYWVDQSAAAAAQVRDSATTAGAAGWAAFTSWYAAAAVASQASASVEVSQAAQDAAAGIFTEYIAQLVALLRGTPRVDVPDVVKPTVRNGIDLVEVHSRPAYQFKETVALTGDFVLARERALARQIQLIETDIMLAAREAQNQSMAQLDVTRYRRVLRPEMSQSGPCGLCVVASDRVYTVADLLPIHDRCKCQTMPVIDGVDPAVNINAADLKRIYAAAGDSTSGADLKRTRVSVNEHGELGPVLTTRGQKFTGPTDLGAPPGNPALSRRRLEKLNGILAQLEQRPRSGDDDIDGALSYQRAQIERTSRYAAS